MKQVKHSFVVEDKNGAIVHVAAGTILDDKDPILKGRSALVEDAPSVGSGSLGAERRPGARR